MRYRIFKSEDQYLVFNLTKDPFALAEYQENNIKMCYNYIEQQLGRKIDNEKDLVYYSERM